MFIHHEKSTAGNFQKWQNGLVKIREFRGPRALQVLGGGGLLRICAFYEGQLTLAQNLSQ